MTLITRVNELTNPSIETDLTGWTAFGTATLSRVASFFQWNMQITWGTGIAGSQGAQTTLTGLTVGGQYRCWCSILNHTGTTTTQFGIVGIGNGTAIATTNSTLSKQGTFDFTATATSHTFQISNASAGTAGDTSGIENAIVELKQTAMFDYCYFDGDTPGAQWNAAPRISKSTFANFDPDATGCSQAFQDAAGGPLPMVIVEIDARPVGPGDFVLDTSALDGPDFIIADGPRWYPMGPDVEEVATRRGRQRDDQPMSVGTLSVGITDIAGTFDPDNPSTPLQNGARAFMREGMPIRVGVLMNSGFGFLTYYQLFTGRLEDVVIDRGLGPYTVLTAVDDMNVLFGAAIPPYDPPIQSGQSCFWRAVTLLSIAGYGFYDVDVHSTTTRTMLPMAGGGNVGAELEYVANCEGGVVYVQRNGRPLVGTHADNYTVTPAAVFTDTPVAGTDVEYETIDTSTSVKQIINRAVIDRQGVANNVTAQNDNSVAQNKVHSETVTAPLLNDAEAAALAAYRANRHAKGATRVNSITSQLAGQFPWWAKLAPLEITQTVRITRRNLGRLIDGVYDVEGIDHTINLRDNTGWQVQVYTSPVDVWALFSDLGQPFRLDTSALDGPDILTDF
jgi:hypothetical protein